MWILKLCANKHNNSDNLQIPRNAQTTETDSRRNRKSE